MATHESIDRLSYETRHLADVVAQSAGLWRDQASEHIHRRYLRPHASAAAGILEGLAEQDEHDSATSNHAEEAYGYQQQAFAVVEVINAEVDRAKRHEQSAHSFLDQTLRHEQTVGQIEAKFRSLIDQANHSCNGCPGHAGQVAPSVYVVAAVPVAARTQPTTGPHPTDNVQQVNQILGWLGQVNPGYDGDPLNPRSVNCGSCAVAVHKRLNGDSSAVATEESLWPDEMAQQTGRPQIVMSPEEIEAALRSHGPGAHAVIGVDRRSGAGHWFNAYFDGIEVYAIDGQTAEISRWPPDYGDVVRWDCNV